MLMQRVVTAAVLAPLAIAAVVWMPTPAIALVAGLVFVLGYDEWVRLSGFRSTWVRLPAAVVFAIVLAGLYVAGAPWVTLLVLVLAALWWLLALLWLGHIHFAAAPTRGNGVLKLVAGVLVVVPAWVALLWLHEHGHHGVWLLIALLIVWGADIGAYFAGSRYGRRKLAPRVSPGKTWAGVAGAMVLSVLVMAVAGWLLHVPIATLVALLLLTLVTVAFSVVGDLIESLMKRHAQVKDSGALFPGHGGVFDRLDSVCAFLPLFALGLWGIGA